MRVRGKTEGEYSGAKERDAERERDFPASYVRRLTIIAAKAPAISRM